MSDILNAEVFSWLKPTGRILIVADGLPGDTSEATRGSSLSALERQISEQGLSQSLAQLSSPHGFFSVFGHPQRTTEKGKTVYAVLPDECSESTNELTKALAKALQDRQVFLHLINLESLD